MFRRKFEGAISSKNLKAEKSVDQRDSDFLPPVLAHILFKIQKFVFRSAIFQVAGSPLNTKGIQKNRKVFLPLGRPKTLLRLANEALLSAGILETQWPQDLWEGELFEAVALKRVFASF